MKLLSVIFLLLFPVFSFADINALGIPAVTFQQTDTGGEYTVTIQILALMTLLSLLPAIIMMMTAFTRIIVVMAILRQALGLQQTPSNQVVLGMSLFLTAFIMMPVFDKVNEVAVQPYLNETIKPLEALERATVPMKEFMLAQTRETDLNLFVRISGRKDLLSPDETPLHILIPVFVTSELKTAFQIGFLLFLPFLVIDMVIASILMSLGMMMLSPMLVALPFKLLLFVLVDGWAMTVGSLVATYVSN
jgi:flagellar biosynthetic protein FliP